MKIIKRILFVLLGFIILCVGLLYLFNKEYLLKGIRITYLKGYTTAYIDDYPEFDNRKIEAGQPQTWPEHTAYNSVKATKKLQQINQKLGTVAFLIIKNDSIWYEDYAEGYSADSKTNSFSMAKSITSALLGKAIRDGFIENLDQPGEVGRVGQVMGELGVNISSMAVAPGLISDDPALMVIGISRPLEQAEAKKISDLTGISRVRQVTL